MEDNSSELSEKIFNHFMDALEKENPDLYNRVLDQKFLFIPQDKKFAITKTLINVSDSEIEQINRLLTESAKAVE